MSRFTEQIKQTFLFRMEALTLAEEEEELVVFLVPYQSAVTGLPVIDKRPHACISSLLLLLKRTIFLVYYLTKHNLDILFWTFNFGKPFISFRTNFDNNFRHSDET